MGLAIAVLGSIGCWRSYDTIDAATLRAELDKSVMNSGDTWWYAGSDERLHYFVVRLPPEPTNSLDTAVTRASECRFCVSRSQIRLRIETVELQNDPARWSNLKDRDVEFPGP